MKNYSVNYKIFAIGMKDQYMVDVVVV